MDKFDEHEVCPACGNDPVESGLKWKPKFVDHQQIPILVDGMKSGDYKYLPACLMVTCGQCKYQMKRSCLNEV